MSIEVIEADITRETTDAIVNAANMWLVPGGGVDGAIHRAAGPDLEKKCLRLPENRGVRCPAGEVRVTGPGRLAHHRVKCIIHAVGPNCQSGYDPKKHDPLLASAWRNALSTVAELGLRSVAFPSISTGIYSFPKARAAEIAAQEIAEFHREHPEIDVRICILGGDAAEKVAKYRAALARFGL